MHVDNLECGPVVVPDICQRTVTILGAKGSGKTQMGKSFMYQLSRDTDIDLIIVDPIGKIRVKDFIPIVVQPEDMDKGATLAEFLNKTDSNRVIISLNRMLREEHKPFVDDFFANWQPHKSVIFFDEVHDFLPVNKAKDEYCLEIERLIRHGRNDEVGIIMASQRPAGVAKDALALTDFLVLLRTTWTHDLDAVKDLLANAPGINIEEVLGQIQTMENFNGFEVDFNPALGGNAT